MTCNNVDHYSVLGLSSKAHIDDIRKQYQSLARQYHPDKARSDEKGVEMFHRIQAAYDVLKDPATRLIYDNTMHNGMLRVEHPGNGDVDLDDMSHDQVSEKFAYPCRCGGQYEITEDELGNGHDVALCAQCSLCIRVLYAV
eukprot:Ihof_evm4s88 gene=Ihof_evmTU4s88